LLRSLILALILSAAAVLPLTGCGPSYSPNTYASNAAQQAAKVEEGVIAGVRPVQISAQGAVGGVAGAAAGGVAGSQVGAGPTSAFAAIGGSVLGGLAGVAAEHIVGDTNGFEYIVRKANGDMISVAQKDEKPLPVGQKVLVIAGPQARVVPDYTVPFDAPSKTASKTAAPGQPAAEARPATDGPTHPATTDATESHPAPDATASHPAPDTTASHPVTDATPSRPVTTPVAPAIVAPAEAAVPPQLPAAFGATSATPPPIITPAEPATAASAGPAAPTPKPSTP
jgi:outer membrane lipoprotein SlyB